MIKRVFCRAIGREKQLYSTISEMRNTLKQIELSSSTNYSKGYKPCRAYYCMMCSGWHLTHFKEKDYRADDFVKGLIYGEVSSNLPYHIDMCKRKDELKIANELLYKEEAYIISFLIEKGINYIDDIDKFLRLIKRLKTVTNLAVFKEEYVKYGKL